MPSGEGDDEGLCPRPLPVPLGQHVASCRQCANAYRVLTSDGKIAENFHWSDPQEHAVQRRCSSLREPSRTDAASRRAN
jgi:hypothetical protein